MSLVMARRRIKRNMRVYASRVHILDKYKNGHFRYFETREDICDTEKPRFKMIVCINSLNSGHREKTVSKTFTDHLQNIYRPFTLHKGQMR